MRVKPLESVITAGRARDRARLALTKTLALVCDVAPGRWSYVPALRRTYVKAKLSNTCPIRCFCT